VRFVLNLIYILSAIGMIVSVLMQSSESAGLSGTITGSAQTYFGKKKGIDKFLSKLTIAFAVLFMALSVLLSALTL
jgi:preprotein translocase subunit SecG